MSNLDEEIRLRSVEFLSSIIFDVVKDIENQGEFKDSKNVHSYLFLERINELACSIRLLFENELAITGAMLVRPMSEAYILLKASINDEGFVHRHFNKSARDKVKYLGKIVRDHPNSGFPGPLEKYQGLLADAQEKQIQVESELKDTAALFRDLDELALYLHSYSPATNYLHFNMVTFRWVLSKEGSVLPHDERDLSSVYVHTTGGVAYILCWAYQLFCDSAGWTSVIPEKIWNALLEYSEKLEHE